MFNLENFNFTALPSISMGYKSNLSFDRISKRDFLRMLIIKHFLLFFFNTPFILFAQPLEDGLTSKGQETKHLLPLILAGLPNETLHLTDFTTVYVDKTTNLKLDAVRELWQNGQFIPLTNFDYPSKFKSGKYHYWLQLQLENPTKDTLDLVFRLPRLDSSFYYQFYDNKLEETALFGNQINARELYKLDLPIFSSHSMPFQLLPEKNGQIFIRTSDVLYLTAKIEPLLESREVYYQEKAKVNFLLILTNGIFLGIIFFISLFSLLQYFQNKDKAFLFYAIYTGLLFISFWMLFDEDNSIFKVFYKLSLDLQYLYVPSHICLYFAYALFVHYFINERKQYPLVLKLIKVILWVFGSYLVLTVLVSLFIHVRWSWIIHYYFRTIIISIFFLALLFLLWKIGTPLALYLIFGNLSLLLLSILAPPLLSLTLKSKDFLGTDYTYLLAQLGILIELLFFSLGLGYKRYLTDQEKIKAQREKEELETMKLLTDRLYNNITHEFRTPLTVILGMTENLQSKVMEQQLENMAQPLKMIERNGQNLLRLVNEMLDLAKIESGHLELNLQQADVIPFIKYLAESFHSLAAEKHIKLTIHAEKQSLVMDFDATKLASIVSNLLANAIKFTPEGGEVSVHLDSSTEAEKAYFFIQIKDNGKGISLEEIPYLFDRFYQADSSTARRYEGTGLGLALTRELVDLMMGTIQVKSELGKGSEFAIQLPIYRNTPLVENPGQMVPSTQPVSISATHFSEELAIGANDLPLVLVIEDNKDVAHYIGTCLQGKYQYLYAANGKIGIELALEKIPDLIISDVMMPEKDGFEVCATLKEDERTNHIPIILLTAKVSVQDRLTGLAQGADAYLAKPFEKEELWIRLHHLLELRKTLQRKYSEQLLVETAEETSFQQEDPFVAKASAIVLTELDNEDFSLHELSQRLFLSRSQVHRKLKAVTGLSTTIFIRNIRLQVAKKLLTSSELTIAEIAYQVGFKTPIYFSQIFKETFGNSPSDFRK
ncbi:MAG: ATP-binding protein [Saprospiraceae bacterium]